MQKKKVNRSVNSGITSRKGETNKNRETKTTQYSTSINEGVQTTDERTMTDHVFEAISEQDEEYYPDSNQHNSNHSKSGGDRSYGTEVVPSSNSASKY